MVCLSNPPLATAKKSNPSQNIIQSNNNNFENQKKQKVSHLIHPRHISRAEVCATVVVCIFLLSLPAVALFLTSFCLGSLWGLLSFGGCARRLQNDEPSEQAGQAKHDENYMYNIYIYVCV
jgi:hypothetical protein